MDTRGFQQLARGFGLLEVIVALFVLGVALTGVVRSLGYGVEVAGAAHRSLLARQLVSGMAAELPADPEAALLAASASWRPVEADDIEFPCRRRFRAWSEGARVWIWIEARCELEGGDTADSASPWRPGRAALLVAR